jgi:uncharacterized damage-inducible protein DinB
MGLVQNFRMMSLYNQRMNKQLMHCCLSLSSDMLEKETHSFFSNVISYWNHLLFGDLILMGRLAQNEVGKLTPGDFSSFPYPKSPRDIYFDKLTDLIIVREQVDTLLVEYCNNLTTEESASFITYKTTEGNEVNKAVSDVTQHLFNHQTHHRGQLSCVLSQFGVNYGCMDLPVVVKEGSQL